MKKRFFSIALFAVFLLSCLGAPTCYAASSDHCAVDIDIKPDSISLKEKRGPRITCFVTLPESCKGAAINPGSITLADKIVADSVTAYQDIVIVKFKRADLIDFIKDNGCNVPSTLALSLKGNFTDGKSFAGNDTLELIPPQKVYTYTRPDRHSRGKLVIK
ncbi:MAG: hypothetical protein JRE23_03025 [Deltaproteobacteria bacterium]|nr:hypothetical protein [Deltaproteobacteria bacterium]